MAILVAGAVFLTTILGGLIVYIWSEGRKESFAHRIRAILPADENRRSGFAGKLFSEARKRLLPVGTVKEELIAMITGKELTGDQLLLNQAGFRSQRALRFYQGTRIGLPFLLATAAIVSGKAAGLPNVTLSLFAVMGAIAGYITPVFFLRIKIRDRQEKITDSLPDGLDLLVVCVEAGLGLNASFVKITEEFRLSSPVLSEEFDIVNREMVAGKPRPDALRALADRTGVEEVKSLVAMLIQTEKLGTSLSQSLRVHSDSLRTRRRQRAEEAAAKTTIKLVFPLVFLMFPALFVVILGPGVIQIINSLLPVVQK